MNAQEEQIEGMKLSFQDTINKMVAEAAEAHQADILQLKRQHKEEINQMLEITQSKLLKSHLRTKSILLQ